MLINILRGYSPDSTPYPKPPEISKRKIILHHGLPAWQYISERQLNSYERELFRKFNPNDYEGVLVNMNGGKGIADKANKHFNYKGPVGYCAYKEPKGGFGAIICQEIPYDFLGKRVVIYEDVYETGGVITEMRRKLDPNSLTVFVTQKDRIDQLYIPNTLSAFKSVPEWIAGESMNIDYDGDEFYPADSFRDYKGIVIRPDRNTLLEYYKTRQR